MLTRLLLTTRLPVSVAQQRSKQRSLRRYKRVKLTTLMAFQKFRLAFHSICRSRGSKDACLLSNSFVMTVVMVVSFKWLKLQCLLISMCRNFLHIALTTETFKMSFLIEKTSEDSVLRRVDLGFIECVGRLPRKHRTLIRGSTQKQVAQRKDNRGGGVSVHFGDWIWHGAWRGEVNHQTTMSFWCDFGAGWFGGVVGLVVGHPFDTLKVTTTFKIHSSNFLEKSIIVLFYFF